MSELGRVSFLGYLKRAFWLRWNVLAVAAGSLAALLSGHADVALPLIAAGEVLYLAALATRPRFQAAIDAEQHKAAQIADARQGEVKASAVLAGLGRQDRERFERLRGLCLQLARINQGVRAPAAATAAPGPADELQQGGINRLLWIYLKMLHTKGVLEQFFATIDAREIERTMAQAKSRLAALGPETEDTPGKAKQRKSLQDTLDTSAARQANFDKAKENYDLVQLELDRLYTKIASLCELGINRQEPDFITSEVDNVSASVEQTEKAMSELEFLTGLTTAQDDGTPELLHAATARVEEQVRA